MIKSIPPRHTGWGNLAIKSFGIGRMYDLARHKVQIDGGRTNLTHRSDAPILFSSRAKALIQQSGEGAQRSVEALGRMWWYPQIEWPRPRTMHGQPRP
jgi:hypothetical protein